MTHIPVVARGLLALIFIAGGLNGFLLFMPVPQPLHPWLKLTMDSGMLYVPKTIELVGAALLWTRYRALGLCLLWPIIVNILLFHAFLDPRGLANGLVLVVLGIAAGVPERARLKALVAPVRARTE
ncbi:MAG: membrane spanning transport protein [Myxococcales bacterium]|nr:membrane spanning transport protein [Myxococcales bacterium]MDD9968524.1 membrane spanning transport protein [Myxococcales bacterium]